MKPALFRCILYLATALVVRAQTNAGNHGMMNSEFIPRMVAPSIDKANLPFCYPSRPTDQLSVMDSPSGAEITPEGYVYTGYGELMFFVGIERIAVNQRIRTLQDGYLPIFTYTVDHDGLRYRFTMFAASLGSEQTGRNVVNFVRVAIDNRESDRRIGFLTTAWRFQGEQTTTFPTGDNRFIRPQIGRQPGDHEQPGESFNPRSSYSVRENAFVRDGKAIYFFPAAPRPQISASYRDYYNRSFSIKAPFTSQPDTPVAVAEYQVEVPAGATRTLDFKVPLVPIAKANIDYFRATDDASFDEYRNKVSTFWRATLFRGTQIVTPEDKVNDAYRASLIYALTSLNKVGDNTIQTVNDFQYHAFYLRDSADFVRMYDMSGYPQIAESVLDFFSSRQKPDGNFLSQPGQYDGWGEALWTYGEHYRMTHSLAFANAVYPNIQRAVAWLKNAMAKDPFHIVPATDVRDNEYVPGHLTGHNFLALDGLQAAVRIAHALGRTDDEQHFSLLEQELRSNFMKQLDAATARTSGSIPPALDSAGGTDWGNLLSLVPEQQLSPFDPRVTATLRQAISEYQEGLITYRQPDQGTYLHHYLTIKNTLTELIRGEQEQAIREFYAELIHTSSTHAGWEYSIRPWGDRDFSGNLAPHGWFAVDYRILLQEMMVREDGSKLHLLSAVSPAWIGVGKAIRVDNANTYFGQYGFILEMPSKSVAILTLDPAFTSGFAPQEIVLHIPWFMELIAASVDGKAVKASAGNTIHLNPGARNVTLTWKRLTLAPDMPKGYADAVARFEREYKHRFRERTGYAPPASEPLPAE